MSWDDVWKIVLCAVGSAGGIGAIIVCAVKYASNIIASRLSQKYEAKLQEELEKHRAVMEKKTYITKAQYDTEFGIYRSISKNFFEALVAFNSIFSADYRFESQFTPTSFEQARTAFMKVATKLQAAQDTLYENAAFITKPLYDKYENFLVEATGLFWEYKEKLFSEQIKDVIEDSNWLDAKHQCVKRLEDMLFALNEELRIYLQNLTIVE